MTQTLLFEEAVGKDRLLLGGKGFGLVEMTSTGLPVPPGFIITTDVCKLYYAKGGTIPAGLFDEVKTKIKEIERQTGKGLGSTDNPLLLSVRSGAPFSMPGMMDTILNLGLNDLTTKRIAELTSNDRFAHDSYRRLIQMFGKTAMGIKGELFERVLEQTRERLGVKTDIELPPEELKRVVEEFKQIIRRETHHEFPQDPMSQLQMAIEAVLKSWNNSRARDYRKFYKISEDLGTAVNIQAMVFGNLGVDSGSGVGFTRNPSTGEKGLYGEYLANSQGEDVVAGTRTPISIDKIGPDQSKRLQDVSKKLELHFRDMQDFEFTIEKGKLYMLQTRNGKRTAQAAVKIAVDMVVEGLITKDEALTKINPDELGQLLHRRLSRDLTVKPIAHGLNASPGATTGKVVFQTDESVIEGSKGERVILVRPETTPEDIKGFIASQGVLTERGGMTSHAAVVARGMGKPAVVGCSEIKISPDMTFFTTKGGDTVRKGEIITLDGTTGSIFLGELPTEEPELTAEFSRLLAMSDEVRKLGVWANADTPEATAKAVQFGAEGIGLCRTERMFNAPNRLPIVREMILSRDEEGRKKALHELLPFQLEDFKTIFRLMKGKPVVIRLLDLPLHEFLPPPEKLTSDVAQMKARRGNLDDVRQSERLLERVLQLSEHNPMLGHRGCRLAITYPEIYEMQTKAILKAAIEVLDEEGQTVEAKIMLPLVSVVPEIELLRKLVERSANETFEEVGQRIPFEIGTMIETPRAALVARDVARYADFFSFGTNDLTQTTFAFSRDDVEAKFISTYLDKGLITESPFDSIDKEGVGKLIEIATQESRSTKPEIELGICGELGGDPKSIRFFHSVGLDYVSCSPFRIPIAKLAAAQAALAKQTSTTTV
jgi:pyruvate,orthophosphate dikinase